MNPRAKIATASFLLAAGWAVLSAFAQSGPATALPALTLPAPASTNASPAIPLSVFMPPSADGQGRNPFFPDDSELTQSTNQVAAEAPRSVELTLQGFSGEGDNRIAIINEENFAAGDTESVPTASGRIMVHCIELKTNSVIVEVDGGRRELRFHPDQ